MTGLLRYRLAIILCATLLGIGGARAADVPPHLVGMARLLTSQIGAADFGDPALAQRVEGIIKRARLRSWAGAPPKIAADLAKLAVSLDLDLALEGHRAALDRLLAARDSAAQHDALGAICGWPTAS